MAALMLERFTKDARELVAAATAEARRLGAAEVGSEHLLLAVLDRRGPSAFPTGPAAVFGPFLPGEQPVTADRLRARLAADDPDAEALEQLGISLPEVRRRMEEVFGPRVWRAPRSRTRYSRDAKRALELALRESLELATRRIDSRHVLLGLLREDCTARRLLADLGGDPGEVYRAVRVSMESVNRIALP